MGNAGGLASRSLYTHSSIIVWKDEWSEYNYFLLTSSEVTIVWRSGKFSALTFFFVVFVVAGDSPYRGQMSLLFLDLKTAKLSKYAKLTAGETLAQNIITHLWKGGEACWFISLCTLRARGRSKVSTILCSSHACQNPLEAKLPWSGSLNAVQMMICIFMRYTVPNVCNHRTGGGTVWDGNTAMWCERRRCVRHFSRKEEWRWKLHAQRRSRHNI